MNSMVKLSPAFAATRQIEDEMTSFVAHFQAVKTSEGRLGRLASDGAFRRRARRSARGRRAA